MFQIEKSAPINNQETFSLRLDNEPSLDRLNGLKSSAHTLHQTLPNFVGMTAFGSTVRGEARPDSDVDICVFMHVNELDGLDYTRVPMNDPEIPGTFEVAGMDLIDTRLGVKDSLDAAGLSSRDADIIVVPINESIIEDTAATLLNSANEFVGGNTTSLAIPRNIKQLFHAPIDTAELKPYIAQALSALNKDPMGNVAWQLIRTGVSHFENGRERSSINMLHRYFPATLEEANTYYISEEC